MLSESEHELLKKEYEILKEELASEVKLHTELQEIHNICEKKFNVLNAQYLNCSEQLEFYHSENENLIRYKDGLEQELLHFKDKCASQEENIIKLEGDLQKAPEQIIKEEITKQP